MAGIGNNTHGDSGWQKVTDAMKVYEYINANIAKTAPDRTNQVSERPAQLNQALDYMNDPVNHPKHYTSGKIEVADFIADQKMNFFLGNVVKYVCRAGKKDPDKLVEDLEKAKWYLEREIRRVKEDQEWVNSITSI